MGKSNSAPEHLLMLINYWIEHNHEHGHEYERWIQKVKDMGYSDIANEISEALELTETIQHHFLHARKLLTSNRLFDKIKEYHKPEETHKQHHHEHISFHVIGIFNTPYSANLPKRGEEKDGEFFIEIYGPYNETIAHFDSGGQALIVYAIKDYQDHTSVGQHHALSDGHGPQFILNPIDVITVTVKKYEHGRLEIAPVPVYNDARILLLKQL